MLPCVAGSVSWLVVSSVVSVQNKHFFFFFQSPGKEYRRQGFFRALMSQERNEDNEMPLGEEQDNSEF